LALFNAFACTLRPDRSKRSWNQLSLDCRITLDSPILHSKQVAAKCIRKLPAEEKRVAV
jgi:hypothetical protein